MTVAVPPVTCKKRGGALGVSTTAERSFSCLRKASLWLSSPKHTVLSPPTGPLVATTASAREPSSPRQMVEAPPGAWCNVVLGRSVMEFPVFWLAPLANAFDETSAPVEDTPPRQTEELPPGACGKRGAAPGVSTTASRCTWRWLKISLESSAPKTTVALPPVACWNRGAASGVSTGATRSALCWLKTSLWSSLPSEMVASPPTGPRAAMVASLGGAPPKQIVAAPPGGSRVEPSAAAGASADMSPKQTDAVPPGA
mmetsp:Transcript_68506/g.191039  ORF Transcript_68506/g.191039 Transcript_68506/m.191039 type:complete len:256 (-) Transcript_68506:392-1159(-)